MILSEVVHSLPGYHQVHYDGVWSTLRRWGGAWAWEAEGGRKRMGIEHVIGGMGG